MAINSINSAFNNISSLYSSMYNNSMSLFNNKLTGSLFPLNNAKNSSPLSASSLQYVTNIKIGANKLTNAIKGLSNGSSFRVKTMTSSDNETLSVNYVGSIFNRPGNTTVKINQLASGQKNEGTKLQANENFGSIGGTDQQFKIEMDGKTTILAVKVKSTDTNEQVQQKMADAINSAGIGVKASVVSDAENKTSALNIEAVNTGADAKSKFSITDMVGSELVAKTGAGTVTKDAQNALYSVNGGPERSSKTNTLDLGGGLNVTFKKASDKEITISQGMDIEYAKSAVKDLVMSYNDIYIEALKNSSDPKAESLATRLLNVSKMYAGTLSEIGVGFDKDGKMTINEDQFNKAAENGKLEKFFTDNSGKNYGFTYQLGKLADNVSRNTSNFVTKSIFGNNLMENFSYTGAGNMLSYNYMNSGWLFDYLY